MPLVARQDGFTLVETMVSMVVGLAVLFAVLLLVDLAPGQAAAVDGRVTAVGDVDLVVDRVQDDVRQTYAVLPWPGAGGTASNQLQLKVVTRNADGSMSPHTIVWDCTKPGARPGTKACTRQDVTTSAKATHLGSFRMPAGGAFLVLPPGAGAAALPSVRVRLAEPVTGRTATVDLASGATPRTCQAAQLTAAKECPWP
ncbi:prepilin-type N-terminal cleavage/methylation domain-containing protein [Conexibacter sp. SYSU D00693]|uniref:prepilin-type N-terminal cleavage/methylation domain-containing protein n=1 Tax=Conexibacter sp. SYSU D00693 TaxID=2812560 RepID=UPI00196A4328|nr:prepilin-type N-terminal cleavage/methylation domain-containing protein [Conexibacter sp. SYSU D00693]